MNDKITVVIPTSPITKHPSTAMIRKTIRLMRQQLPSSRILILVDGVRPEQEYLTEVYNQYKARLYEWSTKQDSIDLIIFDEFLHQSGMIRRALQVIDTPLLLFIEHDFPVVDLIPWSEIVKILLDRELDLVRFYWEPNIVPEHEHLFLDKTPVVIGGVSVVRTGQWSQRPHVARTAFYRRVISKQLTDRSRTFIEDGVHGYFGYNFTQLGEEFWRRNRMAVYHPPTGSISRCKHLDGRGSEQKYEMIS